MKPRASTRTPAASAPIDRPFGRASDRDQHVIVGVGAAGAILGREAHLQALLRRRHAGDLGVEQDLAVARPDALFERAHQVRIAAGHQLRRELDHADLRTQGIEHAGHLQSDDAAADHQEASWILRQLERAARVDDARIVRHERQPHRLGTGGDDAMLEANAFAAAALGDLEHMRADELADAAYHLDLALLGQHGQSAGQLAHHARLPGAQLAGVHPGRLEHNAMRTHLARIFNDLRGVQQRLGRNAADVEAHAAECLPALDQRDLEPEIRGAKGRGVTAGPRAQHQQLRAARSLVLHRCRPGRDRGCGHGARRGYCRGFRRRHRRRWRRRHSRGGRGGRGGRSRRGRGRRAGLQQQQRRTLGNLAAFADQQLYDLAASRRRHVHRRLVGLERDQRCLELDVRHRA